MKSARWLFLCALSFPLAVDAGSIYKCTAEGETAYQSAPCAAGRSEEILVAAVRTTRAPAEISKPDIVRAERSPAVATPQIRPGVLFQATLLSLGMTDDEVLNLPRWGRPAKITRSKGPRAWREEWSYGSKRLVFENARLTSINDEPEALEHLASATEPSANRGL